jgi:hypothetical protein
MLSQDSLLEEFKRDFLQEKNNNLWINKFLSDKEISVECWKHIFEELFIEPSVYIREYSFVMSNIEFLKVVYLKNHANPKFIYKDSDLLIPDSFKAKIEDSYTKLFPVKMEIEYNGKMLIRDLGDFSIEEVDLEFLQSDISSMNEFRELFSVKTIIFDAKLTDERRKYFVSINTKKTLNAKSSPLESNDGFLNFKENSKKIGTIAVNLFSLSLIASIALEDRLVNLDVKEVTYIVEFNIKIVQKTIKVIEKSFNNTDSFNNKVAEYSNIVELEARKRGISISDLSDKYSFVMMGVDVNSDVVGRCLLEKKVISLEENFSFETFLHEVGHCEFNYSHVETDLNSFKENHFHNNIMDYSNKDSYPSEYYTVKNPHLLDTFFNVEIYPQLYNSKKELTEEGVFSHLNMVISNKLDKYINSDISLARPSDVLDLFLILNDELLELEVSFGEESLNPFTERITTLISMLSLNMYEQDTLIIISKTKGLFYKIAKKEFYKHQLSGRTLKSTYPSDLASLDKPDGDS